jgi:phospholipase C accessory protein PlcR
MKQSKKRWRSAWIVAMAVVVLAAGRYLAIPRAAPVASARATAVSTPRAPRPSLAAASHASARGAEPGPAERALDLSALRKSLSGRSDADAQVRRIVALARFRDRMAAYASSGQAMPEAERAQTARRLLAELPEHVARNEILPVQAQVMTAALLVDAEPDPAARAAQIEATRAQWDAYARQTVGPSPALDPRAQAYTRQGSDIVAQIQSVTADPEQQQVLIAQRLQALRVQLFDHASLPVTH